MAVVDGMFCLDARVVYRMRDAIIHFAYKSWVRLWAFITLQSPNLHSHRIITARLQTQQAIVSVIQVHCVSKKTKQICFCQNCIKFRPILIIFGRKMANDPNICEVHSFSASP